MQEEEKKAQAKVFVLGAREKTLHKQAEEFKDDISLLQELQVKQHYGHLAVC